MKIKKVSAFILSISLLPFISLANDSINYTPSYDAASETDSAPDPYQYIDIETENGLYSDDEEQTSSRAFWGVLNPRYEETTLVVYQKGGFLGGIHLFWQNEWGDPFNYRSGLLPIGRHWTVKIPRNAMNVLLKMRRPGPTTGYPQNFAEIKLKRDDVNNNNRVTAAMWGSTYNPHWKVN